MLFCSIEVTQGAVWFELPQVVAIGDGVTPATGYFDVVVRADPSDLPKLVSAYNLDFYSLSPLLHFGVPQAAPNPLIAGTPLNFSPTAQHVRVAQDLLVGSVSLVDGMGLARVPFQVQAGSSGIFPLTLGPLNELSDPYALAISLQTTDTGSITVNLAIPGDYDLNGVVNADDYHVWRRTFGSVTDLAADGNGDNVVDATDYLVWRNNLGIGTSAANAGPTDDGEDTESIGSEIGASELVGIEIPEPATSTILMLWILTLTPFSRRATSASS